jgi:hypothetical protein
LTVTVSVFGWLPLFALSGAALSVAALLLSDPAVVPLSPLFPPHAASITRRNAAITAESAFKPFIPIILIPP